MIAWLIVFCFIAIIAVVVIGDWLLKPISVEVAEARKQADKKKKQRKHVLWLNNMVTKKDTPIIFDSSNLKSAGVLGLVDTTEEYDYRGVHSNLVCVPDEDLNRHTLDYIQNSGQ